MERVAAHEKNWSASSGSVVSRQEDKVGTSWIRDATLPLSNCLTLVPSTIKEKEERK